MRTLVNFGVQMDIQGMSELTGLDVICVALIPIRGTFCKQQYLVLHAMEQYLDNTH